ncbi:MAG: ABC transporter ATP-binding protein [Candidatus Coatesbacteria bacterium]|nr:ABC transporter ATP-binding protein [Candidatus Coatesbacteria bacterium]
MIKAENIYFKYQDNYIIEDISFEVRRTSLTGIIGPNGSGKSTLLKLLLKLLPMEKGNIYIKDKSIKTYNNYSLSKIVSYIPQNLTSVFPYSVKEVIGMGREIYRNFLGIDNAVSREILDNVIEMLSLQNLLERSFHDLSGGEQERVLLASALAQDTELLFLDEPTTGLDLHYQIDFLKILKKSLSEKGTTAIIVTHDFSLASLFCDNLLLINNKKIVASGPVENVLTDENLKPIFGDIFLIESHPISSKPIIIPKID